MSARMFPFWVISQPTCIPPVVLVSSDGAAPYVAAFTSQENAIAFMEGRPKDWEFNLVCRATFESVANDLRRFGIHGLCFEPDSRSQGDRISFDELQRLLPMAPEDLPTECRASA